MSKDQENQDQGTHGQGHYPHAFTDDETVKRIQKSFRVVERMLPSSENPPQFEYIFAEDFVDRHEPHLPDPDVHPDPQNPEEVAMRTKMDQLVKWSNELFGPFGKETEGLVGCNFDAALQLMTGRKVQLGMMHLKIRESNRKTASRPRRKYTAEFFRNIRSMLREKDNKEQEIVDKFTAVSKRLEEAGVALKEMEVAADRNYGHWMEQRQQNRATVESQFRQALFEMDEHIPNAPDSLRLPFSAPILKTGTLTSTLALTDILPVLKNPDNAGKVSNLVKAFQTKSIPLTFRIQRGKFVTAISSADKCESRKLMLPMLRREEKNGKTFATGFGATVAESVEAGIMNAFNDMFEREPTPGN